MAEQALRDVQRQVALAPDAADFAKDAKAEVKYNADGTWTATVRGEENIKRAMDMQDAAREVEVERGAKLASRRTNETLLDEAGKPFAVDQRFAERVAKKRGLKPKVNWGRPKARWVARNGELVKVF